MYNYNWYAREHRYKKYGIEIVLKWVDSEVEWIGTNQSSHSPFIDQSTFGNAERNDQGDNNSIIIIILFTSGKGHPAKVALLLCVKLINR